MLSGSSPPAPAAALIGRAAEVEDVLDLLGRARLVTLTGPPGVGKTRLALAVCAERDDVSWVDLAPIRDPRQVRAELARASRPDGDTDRLVVLDNCEHLLASDLADQLAGLLRSTARLQVLATSRERLRLAAEREYAVPPLPMPSDDDADDPARLRGNPAVTLLLDRAPPAVQLTPNTARALAEICIGLDGLPLAIELAAARLRVFTPSELAFRLGRRMSVLTSGPRDAPDRHRDLRAAIAWSHDLLSERDRAVFRRLSVFPGEWNLDSAGAVCAEPDVLDVVESLLDKSLVRRAGEDLDGDARFTMLMSLREYAGEQLEERAEVQATRDRHTTWFTRRALEWEATIGTAAETDTGRSWLPSAPTWRPAWCMPGPPTRVSRSSGWRRRWPGSAIPVVTSPRPRCPWPGSSLPSTTNGPTPTPERLDGWRPGSRPTASVGATSPRSCSARSAPPTVRPKSAGAPWRAPSSDTSPVNAVTSRTRPRSTRPRAPLMCGSATPEASRGPATTSPCWLSTRTGTEDAEQLLTESLELFDSIDYDWAVAVCACLLGTAVVRRGSAADVDRAASLLARAMRLHDEVGDRRGMAQFLGGDGRGGARTPRSGPPPRDSSVPLLPAVSGAAALADRGRGQAPGRPRPSASDRMLGRYRRRSASGARAAPWPRLRPSTSRWRACRAPGRGRRRRRRRADAATARRWRPQVAAGRTNRQIGTALGISEKTAEVHVHNIYGAA